MLTRYTDLVTIKILPYEEQLFVANGRLAPDGLILADISSRIGRNYRSLYYSKKLSTLEITSPYRMGEWRVLPRTMGQLMGKAHSRVIRATEVWE